MKTFGTHLKLTGLAALAQNVNSCDVLERRAIRGERSSNIFRFLVVRTTAQSPNLSRH
jgi:hypothetical protein